MNSMLDSGLRFLVTCSGEDHIILTNCKAKIISRFAMLGFFVLLIFIGCFCSAAFFSYSLFNNAKWITVPLGILWGAVVVNLYLLLLHTISPPIIPLSAKKKKKKMLKLSISERFSFLSFSMMARLGFILLLAIIIAQPISVFCLGSSIDEMIQSHKIEERVQLYALSNKRLIHQEVQEHQGFISKVFNAMSVQDQEIAKEQMAFLDSKMTNDNQFLQSSLDKINRLSKLNQVRQTTKSKQEKEILINDLNTALKDELQSDYKFLTTLDNASVTSAYSGEFLQYRTELKKLIEQKINNYNALVTLLNRSNFYIMQIQLLLKHNLMASLITVAICLLFVLPVYFKYKARNLSARLFSNENHEPKIKKLRNQLIETTDFLWLKKTLLTIDPRTIQTSDYYFRRMMVEHKMILENYEETKVLFSTTLSERVLEYNRQCMNRITTELMRLKKYRMKKYLEISQQLQKEYEDLTIHKFEYWIDCPFRTERKPSPYDVRNNEKALLDFIYNDDFNLG